MNNLNSILNESFDDLYVPMDVEFTGVAKDGCPGELKRIDYTFQYNLFRVSIICVFLNSCCGQISPSLP